MNSKIKELITVILIQLVLTLPFYTSNAYALTISNVQVSEITFNSAKISWNTDDLSSGLVKYGETTSLGIAQGHSSFVNNHAVTLTTGIRSDTTYYFVVESTDSGGNTAFDNNSDNFYTFRTQDIIPPPKVTGLKVVSTTSSSVLLAWDSLNTSDLSNYTIYRERVNIGTSLTNSFNDTELNPRTEYRYKVSAVDNKGNEGELSDTVIAITLDVDTSPPIISNIEALPLTDTTAKITWLTNENATSKVFYGINITDKVTKSDVFETNHSVILDGLIKNQVYTFVVESCDSSNNCAQSQNQTFNAGKDITPPFINLTIPRFVNRRVIDIIGFTEPFSSVTLYVNNMNIPKRSLSNDEVGASGRFIFSQIQLEQDNTIKVVAIDKSNNRNEKRFDVSIDMQAPIVQLNEIPKITSNKSLAISGTVNEPVNIKVFVDAQVNEFSIPSQITGLNATKIEQNSVELQWHESKDTDFSHYVIYRNGIAIATTSPANFNIFIDALVDSGKSYTYEVSAVNILGKEGPKSEPLSIETLEGGAILNLDYPPVDILEDFRKPVINTNASGSFSFVVRLEKGDGTYNLKLVFEDMAENSVVLQRTTTLDTKIPTVKIISPPSGAFIFENVANEVDVIGVTEPNARVHLFVDRTPFSFFNQTIEVSGLPNEVQNLPEAQLDAKCRFNVAAKTLCPTGADFSVDADSEGRFIFENVDLTTIFGGAARVREVPVTGFRDTQLNREAQDAKRTTLVVIATDQSGQRGVISQTISIGTCWSGNQSWDVIPLTQYQSPAFLSTERFAEATETIYFYFNYSYIGAGQNARIIDVSLSRACSDRELVDPRFNVSCMVLPAGNSLIKLNKPDNTVSYSAVPLSTFPGMDRFLADDWRNFFKAVNNELTFPFKVMISYEHEIIDDNGNQKRARERQTTCEQVSYVIDNSIIDPRKVLPDWLLYDFVDILQDTTKTLTEIQEQIDKLIDYVAVGCLASFFLNVAIKIYRSWVEFADEALFKIKQGQVLQFKLANPKDNEECKDIADAIEKGYGGWKLKYFSDVDLEKCFPSSASAWALEEKVYKLQRWSCDRLFGHAAPSKWTETAEDNELHRAITSEKTCKSDADTRGQSIRVEKCKDIAGRGIETIIAQQYIPSDKKCFLVNLDSKDPTKQYIYTFAEQQDPTLVSNKIYKLKQFQRDVPLGKGEIYAIKMTEDRYMTQQPQTCKELCGVKETTPSTMTFNGEQYIFSEGKATILKPFKSEEAILSGCVTVNQCREWYAASEEDKGGITIQVPNGKGGYENKILKDSAVRRYGYTEGCFFDGNLNNLGVISETDSNSRKECCCVGGKIDEFKIIYYHPDEVDPHLQNTKLAGKKVHESKSKKGEPPQKTSQDDKEGYGDMKWSFRYSKIGYLDKRYNPHRYIEGRDLSACLGQNNLFYQLLDREKEVLVVDPFKQDTAALQCLFLTGINQRLERFKNILNAMSSCLIQVRATGRADAGVCKELFTQHLCDAIWQAIRWFIDGCTPSFLGIDEEARDDSIAEYLRLGFRGITQGVSEAQSEITSEYSNAKLNDLLGTGEESVARKVCLAAFGYDWELTAKNLIDAAYSAPFASLVQAITRSREFLTVAPDSLRPKYEYKASWLINPGCDLERYDVQLACVSRKEVDEYPNQINCGALGAPSIAYTGAIGTSTGYNQCDCLELPQEQTISFLSEYNFKQNQLIDRNYRKVIESDRRYDHLKFILRTDRKIPSNAKSNCFPTGYEKGVFYFPLIDKTPRDIADCTVQPASGIISCEPGAAFFSRKGLAQLVEVTINGDNPDKYSGQMVLRAGQPLRVGARVTKTGKDKCFVVSMTPDFPQLMYDGIKINGANDIAPIEITSSLTIGGRLNDKEVPQSIVTQLIAQGQKRVEIGVKFIDRYRLSTGDGTYNQDDKVIIDGIDVDLSKSEPQGNGQTKIQVTDSKIITIEKENAIIKITDVIYSRSQDGTYEAGGVIIINPQQPITQTQQEKTLIVQIFNIKDTSDTYEGASDCNPNDKIIERPYKIIVTQEKGEASSLNPLIRNIQLEPKSPIKKEDNILTISAEITHSSGIERADVIIKEPAGRVILDTSKLERGMSRDSNNKFTYHFITSDLRVAGIYKGEIKAVSRNKLTKSEPFEFEVQCYDAEGNYGRCNSEDKCMLDGKEIQGVLPCATPHEIISTANLIGLEQISGTLVSVEPEICILDDELIIGGAIAGCDTTDLRPEVYRAYNSMKSAAQKDSIKLSLISGYRSFDRQLSIWNRKYNQLTGTESERVAKIAEFSAIPGLSRHHWGTEIDLNSLNPTDFEEGGQYSNIYLWLKNNAKKFGFCQPYDGTSSVVKPEPWHWSYKPLSKQFTIQHINTVTAEDLKNKGILGENTIISNFDFYHRGFISDINPECLS